MEARRLVITGLVQGVGFRYHMVNAALRLGISGWVRNRRDGGVEAIIAGDAESIAGMIHWSRQGPASARIEQVYVEQIDDPPPMEGFVQRPTE